mgnify:CR=1 FL=1
MASLAIYRPKPCYAIVNSTSSKYLYKIFNKFNGVEVKEQRVRLFLAQALVLLIFLSMSVSTVTEEPLTRDIIDKELPCLLKRALPLSKVTPPKVVTNVLDPKEFKQQL